MSSPSTWIANYNTQASVNGIDGKGRKERCRKKKQENVEEANVE
jgi:hypothetical protein